MTTKPGERRGGGGGGALLPGASNSYEADSILALVWATWSRKGIGNGYMDRRVSLASYLSVRATQNPRILLSSSILI